MKNFGLIGAAGYIAPRHMDAIKKTGNNLVAVLDKNDSVGIIDSFFPNADFFVEPERFERYIDKQRRLGKSKIDFLSICSPNYLHDAHIRMALRNDTDAICEKPLVLNPWNLDALQEIEEETGRTVYNILQLRYHPSIIKLKEKVEKGPKDKIYDIDLTYITSRGKWYYYSWKGDQSKSGGIATNIGIHFFDMISYIFGKVSKSELYLSTPTTDSGYLETERARVRWFLSLDDHYIPKNLLEKGQRTFRSITVESKEVEFSKGFTDLHFKSYKEILNGNGFGSEEARTSIELVHKIRNSKPIKLKDDFHPFLING